MKYIKCDECAQWHWDTEKCEPVYEVYHWDRNGDEPFHIHGNSFSDAAENYAKDYNESDGEYDMMRGDDIVVKVVKDGEEKKFSVTAEPTIYYSVSEIKP